MAINLAKNICGIIVSEVSSPEKARHISEVDKKCPYLVTTGTNGKIVCSVYIVPEDRRWWLKYPEMNPKAVGVEKASVYVIEELLYPEDFNTKLPSKKMDVAPCGAKCESCPLREKYGCNGCPATVHYKENKKA